MTTVFRRLPKCHRFHSQAPSSSSPCRSHVSLSTARRASSLSGFPQRSLYSTDFESAEDSGHHRLALVFKATRTCRSHSCINATGTRISLKQRFSSFLFSRYVGQQYWCCPGALNCEQAESGSIAPGTYCRIDLGVLS